MSISPVITFKAGRCEADFSVTPPKVKPDPTPGYLYLYAEDDLVHFCWRSRTSSLSDPELDLVMVPTDGTFTPYTGREAADRTDGSLLKSPLNGRIFVLKFLSSSQRHFFWLQSKGLAPVHSHTLFSPRDIKLGVIVNDLLSGDTDQEDEVEIIRGTNNNEGGSDGDGDATMEDAADQAPEHHRGGSGGADADATGGDVRDEGEQSRDGGADGGRAQDQTQLTIQNFINSLKGGQTSSASAAAQRHDTPSTTLAELLTPATTIPIMEKQAASVKEDLLVQNLPPALLFLEHEVDELPDEHPDPEVLRSTAQALSEGQQTGILRRVLRSPQFVQSLASLTTAIRDGGLPSVCEALGIKVANGGYIQHGGGVPLSGGAAVEAFMKGIKDSVDHKSQ